MRYTMLKYGKFFLTIVFLVILLGTQAHQVYAAQALSASKTTVIDSFRGISVQSRANQYIIFFTIIDSLVGTSLDDSVQVLTRSKDFVIDSGVGVVTLNFDASSVISGEFTPNSQESPPSSSMLLEQNTEGILSFGGSERFLVYYGGGFAPQRDVINWDNATYIKTVDGSHLGERYIYFNTAVIHIEFFAATSWKFSLS